VLGGKQAPLRYFRRKLACIAGGALFASALPEVAQVLSGSFSQREHVPPAR